MQISFYLKRPKSEIETVIFARICYEGYKLKYYTTEKIVPKYWNIETQRAKQLKTFSEHPEFNQRLKNIQSDIFNVYRKHLNDYSNEIPTPNTLKNLLDKEFNKVVNEITKKSFIGFYEEIIKLMINGGRVQIVTGKPYSKATIQVYSNTLNRIKEFQKTKRRIIDFNTIDGEFYSDFVEHLSKRLKLANNTIGKDIKTIKTILNEAKERGISINIQSMSKKFSAISEQSESIYLTEIELKEIEKIDLSKNRTIENVRDLFLIGCRTGLRYSDWNKVTSKHIENGMIEIIQTKTENAVAIPIHETVSNIFNKHNGDLPKPISNQNTNYYLKEIGKQIKCLSEKTTKTITKGGMRVSTNYEKWELLTCHTARRTFATLEYLAKTPTITIMAITGHKTEKSFLKYIKLTNTEHAKHLQQIWSERNKLMAV
jgi:integrase